jgi:Cu/Ag efflux protein CusF
MKRLVFLVLATALSAAVHAQSGGMKGMEMNEKPSNKAQAKVHKASGKVTKVDAAKNAVTVAHEPVATMNWPAMSMTFKVKDKALLEKLKQGEKADFEFVQQGKDYVVTAVK